MKDYSAIGKYHETLFKAECMKRGLIVLQPENAHLPFDLVVFTNSQFVRIQVKGTSCLHEKHKDGKGWNKTYRIPMKTRRNVSYHELGVDFIAAYIEPLSTWYIVPAATVKGRVFEIRPNATGKADTCKERWDYLGVSVG